MGSEEVSRPEAVPAPPASPVFEALGDRPLAATVPAAAWVLADCGFRVDGREYELPLWDALDGAGADALLDLGRVLEAVGGAGSAPASAGDVVPWARAYVLVPRERWRATLEIEDTDRRGSLVRAGLRRSGRAPVAVDAPALLRFLRRSAFRALRVAGEAPRPEKAWYPAALLGLLGPAAAPAPAHVEGGDSGRAALRASILAAARARGGEEREDLARSFLPIAAHFAPREAPSPGDADGLASRLLPLATLAASGDAPALEEILVLSLEYFGREDLFDRALESVFPSDSNPDLVVLRGRGTKPGSVLAEVRGRRRDFVWQPGRGWTLGQGSRDR